MSYSMEGNLTLTCDTATQVALTLSPDSLIEKLAEDTQRRIRSYIENSSGTVFEKILRGMDFKIVEQTSSPKAGLYQIKVSLLASNGKSFDPFLKYLVSQGFGVRGTLKTHKEDKRWKYSTRLGSKQLKVKIKGPKTKSRNQFDIWPEMEITKCKYCEEERLTYK